MSSPHLLINPEDLAPPVGFSHAVAAEGGRTVWIAGQIGCDADGVVVAGGWPAQFDAAMSNVAAALAAAGAQPGHIVSMQIFTTDIDAYRDARSELGPIWRRHMGRHFPAITLLGVGGLVDPAAVVEITATAVIPMQS